MEFDVKIYQLSSDFQKDYPTGRYPELMCKKGRPYSCLLVDLQQDYFDQAKAVVDQDEYTETLKNIKRIVGEAVDYVDTYINHVTGKRPLHLREYQRKYQYSTLPYFHDIMGI